MRRISRIVMATLSIVFVVAVLIFFMSTTIIDTVSVTGNRHNSRSEILKLVGLSDTSSVLDVLINRVSHIEDEGYINTLDVEKVDLKNVRIIVAEKEIIGYVEYMGKYICLDNRGYIVDYTDGPDEGKPIIKGIDLTSFKVDEPLEVSSEIITAIDAIYTNTQAFDVDIKWIDFQYGQGNRIYLYTETLEIRIGDISKIEEKFEALHEVITVLPEDEYGILFVEDVEDDIIFKRLED